MSFYHKGDNKINKLRRLPPTLKESKRYIVYKMIGQDSVSFNELRSSVDAQCFKFLGELNYSRAGILHLNENRYGIIRVNSKYINDVKTAISLTDNVSGKKVIVNCVGVSGTLKKARLKFMKKEDN